MQTLSIRLSDNHGVALLHSSALAQAEVVADAENYGRVASHSTYALRDGSNMTFLFFTEPEDGDACFAALRALAVAKPDSFYKVGWIHENGEAAFARKPYVKEKLPDPRDVTNEMPPVAAGAGTAKSPAFFVIYTSRLSAEKHATAKELAARYALELFEDAKDGGRVFCRFTSDSEEEACRHALNQSIGPLGRDISFADAADFASAKKDVQQ